PDAQRRRIGSEAHVRWLYPAVQAALVQLSEHDPETRRSYRHRHRDGERGRRPSRSPHVRIQLAYQRGNTIDAWTGHARRQYRTGDPQVLQPRALSVRRSSAGQLRSYLRCRVSLTDSGGYGDKGGGAPAGRVGSGQENRRKRRTHDRIRSMENVAWRVGD